MGLGLGKLFGTGVTELVGSVGKVLDDVITNKEEKAKLNIELQTLIFNHDEKMLELTQNEIESYLKDTQSAREMNSTIQNSDKASWLAKNVLYILALLITGGFFGLLTYMLAHEVPTANKDVLNILLGSLGTAWITIISYFFGSSVGAKTNSEVIRKIAANK